MFPFGNSEAIEQPRRPNLTSSSTLQDALAPFQAYMADRQFTAHTVNAFNHDLGLLSDFLGAATALAQCSTHRLEEFLHYLQHGREAPCSPRSLERRITTLKVFFGWLAAQNVLAADPPAPLVHDRPGSPLPQILSPGEVERVLAGTAALRDAAEAPDARPSPVGVSVAGHGHQKGRRAWASP
jgi:integrase/recombinase XerD